MGGLRTSFFIAYTTMKKYFPLLVLPFLVFCGGSQAEEVVVSEDPPTYCIRSAEDTENGTILVDIPGYPYGQTDPIHEISKEAYEYITTGPQGTLENCPVDDPRMELQSTEIEWMDGSVTNLTVTSD